MIPKKQTQTPIAIHFRDKFKGHIDELMVGGVIEGLLEHKDAIVLVSNLMVHSHTASVTNPVFLNDFLLFRVAI